MRTPKVFLIAIAFLLFGGSLLNAESSVLVAVSILPQLEFVEQIAGDNGYQTMVLIPPGASPATYELTPDQMRKLSRAAVYFKLGSGLPFENTWLEKISELNKNMPIIDCAKGIELKSGAADSDHNNGHRHSASDPHIWCSPANALKMVDNIKNGLVAIDSEHQSEYESNAEIYKRKIRDLDLEIRTLFQSAGNRKFIIFHPSWGYFADDYGLIQLPIEIEGKEPGAGDLVKLIELSRRENLRIVFASPQFNTESAEMIAREINGRVELIDPLRPDYLTNLREVAGKLSEAMK